MVEVEEAAGLGVSVGEVAIVVEVVVAALGIGPGFQGGYTNSILSRALQDSPGLWISNCAVDSKGPAPAPAAAPEAAVPKSILAQWIRA